MRSIFEVLVVGYRNDREGLPMGMLAFLWVYFSYLYTAKPATEEMRSILLGLHMEELLVMQGQPMNIGLYKVAQKPKEKRLLHYAQRLQRAA